MAKVVLDKVSKDYPGAAGAVRAMDLEIRDEEFLVFVGPSGCGKTTTLRMIAGLESVSQGKIWIGDRCVNQVAPKDRDIAMVFQNYALYPHMSVFKNMAFGLQLRYGGHWLSRGIQRVLRPEAWRERESNRREIPERVKKAAQTLGIEHLLERMPRQLSGGERQRVALGRAIVREPAAFLFDEPLSNLDAKRRTEMRRELKQLHQRLRATMIYVTHDQVEALTLGERIVVMNQGVIQQVGRPLDVYREPENRFVASFIGSPAMNLMTTQWRQGRVKLGSLELPWQLEPSGKSPAKPAPQTNSPVELGIRPEDLYFCQPDDSFARGQVTMIEPLGDATLYHVELADEQAHESSRLAEPNSRVPAERQHPETERPEEHGTRDAVKPTDAPAPAPRLTVVVKLAGSPQTQAGEKVHIGVRPERIHWFCGKSGHRIDLRAR